MSRNLIKYPIIRSEIVTCLEMLADELGQQEGVGDMRPTLLKIAAKIIAKRMDNKSVYHLRNLKSLEPKNVTGNKISA